MDQCILHCEAVRRGAPHTFVMGDMPFMSYQRSDEDAVVNAGRFFKESRVDAIKLEGGQRVSSRIKAIVDAGMVVSGHIGLTPQSSGQLGGHKAQGRTAESANLVIADALAVEEAGAHLLLLEAVPPEVASFNGISNKCSYCMAVCPASEEVIGPYLEDRKDYVTSVVKPLQERLETVYMVPGSDAQAHVARRFPHKTAKPVSNGLRANSVENFLQALPFLFQPGQSEGMNTTYHFTFTGAEQIQATVVIRDKAVDVGNGHVGTPDLRVKADSETWVKFLAKEANIFWAMARRKIRVKGSPALLKAFGRCFPS